MRKGKFWARELDGSARPAGKAGVSCAVVDGNAEILIYDEIGWFGVWAEELVMELNRLEADTITVRINSPGGDVDDGTAIYNALMRHPAKVTTSIEGLAASMASVIALAGEKVVMARNAFFMIHNPWTVMAGDYRDMGDMATMLKKYSDVMAELYADRTGRDLALIKAEMDAETWFTAEEAKAAGFVHEVTDNGAAALGFDTSMFSNAPRALLDLSVQTKSQTDESGKLRRRMERRLRLAHAS